MTAGRTKQMRARKRQGGFTLIELMITVAIVSILASVAYPVYTSHLRKGKRAEARASLMNLLQQQERYMTQKNEYLAFAAGSAPSTFKGYSGQTPDASTHDLGARLCQTVGGNVPTIRDCVEVFAQPRSSFSDADAGTLSIDTMGRRRCSGTTPAVCWK